MSLARYIVLRVHITFPWVDIVIDSDGTAESLSRAPMCVQVGNKNSCVQYSLVEPAMVAGDDDEMTTMGEDDEEENDKIDELLLLAEDYKEQQL